MPSPIVSHEATPVAPQNGGGEPRHGGHGGHDRRPVVAISFVILLLVLATTSQGAFSISHWAPLALFTLAILIGAWAARGRAAAFSTGSRVALVSIWGLAAWSLLSMLWASSSADAWIAADRTILYAALFTLPFAFSLPRTSLAAAGWSLSAGISVVALYTLGHLLVDGSSLFLAGRLNAPVNYRNATALLFALPVWPLVIATAARPYRRGVRAAAFALATLCLGLAFLTQSRGIVIGLLAGGAVALCLGPDRVRRAWVALLAVGGVALASPWLLRPYHAFQNGRLAHIPHEITVAALALLVLTVVAFLVGMLLAVFDNGLRAHSAQMRTLRPAARIALAAVVLVGVVGGLAAIGNPITYAQRKWDEFRNLQASTNTASTRLLSVGGQRYDLWRVAVKEFRAHPLQGVGADNYAFGYYRYRATNRNLNDPHSLLFALLGEEGVVGIVLFAAFLIGIALALRRGWRTLPVGFRRHAVAPAAAGVVLIGQSLVDWIWLIPGLTAVGLLSLALSTAMADSGTAERPREADASPSRRGWASAARYLWLGVLTVAALSVLALFISDAYVQRARSLINNPVAELSAARTASTFDPWSVTPHYLEASALETMGRRSLAHRQLLDALSLEPGNFATLGVLGDFEARRGNFAAAQAYYRRALALNPLDAGLRQLARIHRVLRRGRPSGTG